MPNQPDREAWQRAVDEQLQVGEVLILGPLTAITPNPDPGSAFGLAFAFPLLWLTRAMARRRTRRSITDQTGIPMDRRMVVAVTDKRVLVWSANRRWSPAKYLGDLSRDRITSADAPTVGAGWRRVVITIVDGQSATLKVASTSADALAAELSHLP